MELVSIVMPTYNRASFLESALKSISSQHYSNWELIIVDDGSSDSTQEVLQRLLPDFPKPVQIVFQANSGPAAARNAGIGKAQGSFIAFFDSDDHWLPEHLSLAMDAFSKHQHLQWVYFPCKRIDKLSSEVLLESTFYTEGRQNALFRCSRKIADHMYLLNNEQAATVQIDVGIDSGFQNSVFRAEVFAQMSIPDFRVGEDRLFILKALKNDIVTAFIDIITVIYVVHDDNSSDTRANSTDYQRRIVSLKRLIDSYSATFDEVNLSLQERKLLKKRLSEDYMWKLGYSLELASGRYLNALSSMWEGIKLYPFKFKYWRTLCATLVKIYQDKQIRSLCLRRFKRIVFGKKNVLIIGDSHAGVFDHEGFKSRFPDYEFTVVSVGGATISGLDNPNSKTQAMPIFRKFYYNLKPDLVITQIGEVDTGFVLWYKAERSGSPVELLLEQAMTNYEKMLKEFSVPDQTIVVSAPLPTIKGGQALGEVANARKSISATQKSRINLTLDFNQKLHHLCDSLGCHFVNLDKDSPNEKGNVRENLLSTDPCYHHYDSGQYREMLLEHIENYLCSR